MSLRTPTTSATLGFASSPPTCNTQENRFNLMAVTLGGILEQKPEEAFYCFIRGEYQKSI